LNKKYVNEWGELFQKVKRKDYVQILVDAQRADLDGHSERKDFDPNFLIETERKLSYDEITINLIQFLLGGLDTTSATLSFCLYALCKHPEEMRKLQEEIDSFVDDVT
jgi:cytochrome P450/NADPH-cytochrome P450 reductase